MTEWFDPSGRSTYGIGICDRCKIKMSIEDLFSDPNTPGLKVCVDCLDLYDPYRLPARQTENISLPFTRPDNPLSSTDEGVSNAERGPPLVLAGVYSSGSLTERLNWSVPAIPFTEYRIYRAIDGGAYSLITTVGPFTNTYNDTGVDRTQHSYTWYATYVDIYGVESLASNIVALAFQPSLPIAIVVGNGSSVYRSPDLENWTARPIGLNASWVSGAFAPSLGTQGRFVIINTSGFTTVTAYSDDGGFTWNLTSDMPLITGVAEVVWDPVHNVFILTAAPNAGNARIYRSANGINWSLSTTGARAVDYQGAAYDDVHGTLVLVGNAGVFDHDGGLTSTDGGLTWTIRTINDGGWGHITEVQYTGFGLVGCGPSSLTYNQSLDGGITWTGGAGPFVSAFALGGLPDGTRFVRVRNGANAIDYAATFAGAYTNVPQGNVWNDVRYDRAAFGFAKFLGVSATKAGYSVDGVTWTNPASFAFPGGGAPQKVVFGSYTGTDPVLPDIFVVSCTTTREFVYSTNATNWTLSGGYGGAQPPGVNGYGVCYGVGQNRWFATTNPFNGIGATSDDSGHNWTLQTPNPGGLNYERCVFAFGAYYNGSNNFEILKSTTALGGTWANTSGVSHASFDLHYAPSISTLASAGKTGATRGIRYTLNGSAWSDSPLTGVAAAGFLYAIGYDPDRALWFIVDSNGPAKIYTASTLTGSWTQVGTLPGITASSNDSRFAFKPGGVGQPIVLVTGGRTFQSTDNGATWVQKVNAGTDVLWSVTFSVFIAVHGPNIATSPDGNVWTNQTVPGGKNFGGIAKGTA